MAGVLTSTVAVVLLLAGCQSQDDPTDRSAKPPPAADPTTGAPADPTVVEVSARANIFGAGTDTAPSPQGGGGGVLPPGWELPDGGKRVVTVPEITGEVTPIASEYPYNGPGGDGVGATDVSSYGGISGIVNRKNGMFLVGVFLGDEGPTEQAPERLNVTRAESDRRVHPKLGQTFFVGDGKGKSFIAPAAATRLYLGFADSSYYQGQPGFYNNNSGKLFVRVEVTVDGVTATPSQATSAAGI